MPYTHTHTTTATLDPYPADRSAFSSACYHNAATRRGSSCVLNSDEDLSAMMKSILARLLSVVHFAVERQSKAARAECGEC